MCIFKKLTESHIETRTEREKEKKGKKIPLRHSSKLTQEQRGKKEKKKDKYLCDILPKLIECANPCVCVCVCGWVGGWVWVCLSERERELTNFLSHYSFSLNLAVSLARSRSP